MKKCFPSFYISPLTVVYFAIALFLGRFYYLFLFLLVTVIHELCHCFGAIIFKIKVQEIEMLPFGFYAKIDNLETYHPLKQVVILILGPLSFFISGLLFKILYEFDIISIYGYNHGLNAAINILIFNLLPIYPLDGNRILNALLSYVFEESRVRIISCIITGISSIFVSGYLLKNGQIIVMSFIAINSIKYIVNSYHNYYNFLLFRLLDTTKRKVKISHNYRLFRHYDNYSFDNKKVVNEKGIVIYKINKLIKCHKNAGNKKKTTINFFRPLDN